jgi:hypothetical protein
MMSSDDLRPPRPVRPAPVVRAPGRPRPNRPAARPARRPAWGWLEWFVLSQTIFPALMFVPGLSAIRTPLRMAAYAMAPVAWFMVARSGRRRAGSDSFPARPWLLATSAWLVLSILHPNSYSLVASTAQAALYISVLSPAFWAPTALTATVQLRRLMLVLFLCNAASAVVGIGQVFRPQTFNPPVIPAMNNMFSGEDLMYETGDGRKILRPCGLTDSPGAAAPAGMAAAMLGLCWALLPVAAWKRLASLGLAFLGVAVIYYTQVRFTLVMLGICIAGLTGLLMLRRDAKKAVLLSTLGAVLLIGALGWVASSTGSVVTDRFMTLFTGDPGKLYQESRGGFVQNAFEEVLWRYPLGYGMGWWGMIQASFGNRAVPSPIWVEVMWPGWIYDGGFPLLIAYAGALAVAMLDSVRIALRSKDRELAYWAAVIVAFNLSVLATTFSYATFLSPLGVQFWMLAAALHAADARAQPPRKAAQPRP